MRSGLPSCEPLAYDEGAAGGGARARGLQLDRHADGAEGQLLV